MLTQAIVCVSRMLLESGMMSLLKTSFSSSSLLDDFHHAKLIALLMKAYRKIWVDIEAELKAILIQFGSNKSILESYQELMSSTVINSFSTSLFSPLKTQPPSSSSALKISTKIRLARNEFGRCIESTETISKGQEDLLIETPFCITPAMRKPSSPVLLEGDEDVSSLYGCILAEHVAMTISIAEYFQSFPCKSRHYDDFLRTLESHLFDPTAIKKRNNRESMERSCSTEDAITAASKGLHSGEWSVEQRAFFATISVLTTLISLSYSSNKADNLQLENAALQFFNILCRLPTNTHCISMVVDTDSHIEGNTIQVEQQKIAYALFPLASAVNHSCAPNCMLKFEATEPSHSNNPISLASISSLRLHLVPSKDIPNAREELTLSYGPLATSMSLFARQACLQKQYLFDCKCSSCEFEARRILRESKFQPSSSPLSALLSKFEAEFDCLLKTEVTRTAVSRQRGVQSLIHEMESSLQPFQQLSTEKKNLLPYADEFSLRQLSRLLSNAYDFLSRLCMEEQQMKSEGEPKDFAPAAAHLSAAVSILIDAGTAYLLSIPLLLLLLVF